MTRRFYCLKIFLLSLISFFVKIFQYCVICVLLRECKVCITYVYVSVVAERKVVIILILREDGTVIQG